MATKSMPVIQCTFGDTFGDKNNRKFDFKDPPTNREWQQSVTNHVSDIMLAVQSPQTPSIYEDTVCSAGNKTITTFKPTAQPVNNSRPSSERQSAFIFDTDREFSYAQTVGSPFVLTPIPQSETIEPPSLVFGEVSK